MSSIRNVRFLTDLYTVERRHAVRKHGAKVEAVLTRPFRITFDWRGARWGLEIPRDYAAAPTIPPFLRSLVPATGPIRWASFPHDWLYEHHSMPRADADSLMVAVMKASNDGWFRRARAWLGVRLGGWWPWRKHGGKNTLIGLTRL